MSWYFTCLDVGMGNGQHESTNQGMGRPVESTGRHQPTHTRKTGGLVGVRTDLVEEVEDAGRLDVEARVVERGEEAAQADEDQHGESVHGEEQGHKVDGKEVVVLPVGWWMMGFGGSDSLIRCKGA